MATVLYYFAKGKSADAFEQLNQLSCNIFCIVIVTFKDNICK